MAFPWLSSLIFGTRDYRCVRPIRDAFVAVAARKRKITTRAEHAASRQLNRSHAHLNLGNQLA
jgi:hypothetical protein